MTATMTKRNFLKFAMGSGLAFGSCASAVARVATDDMKWEKTTDVLVLGFGGAGAAAAIEAKKKGADVLILEKMPQPGGNTAVSAGGFMCPDDEAKAYEYLKGTYTYSHAEMDEALLRTFCREVMDLKNFVTGLGDDVKLFVYGYAGFKNLPGQEVIKRYRVRGQKGGPKKGAGDCLFDVLKGGGREGRDRIHDGNARGRDDPQGRHGRGRRCEAQGEGNRGPRQTRGGARHGRL